MLKAHLGFAALIALASATGLWAGAAEARAVPDVVRTASKPLVLLRVYTSLPRDSSASDPYLSDNRRQRIRIASTAFGYPAGSHVIVQRRTAKGTWPTLARFNTHSTSGRPESYDTLSRPGMRSRGIYRFRARLVSKSGRILSSAERRLDIYGPVSLSRLSGTAGGTYAATSGPFAWDWHLTPSDTHLWIRGLSSCRSIVLQVVMADNSGATHSQQESGRVYLGVTQDLHYYGDDAVQRTTPFGVPVVVPHLGPSALYQLVVSNIERSPTYDFYVGGYAFCTSAAPVIPEANNGLS